MCYLSITSYSIKGLVKALKNGANSSQDYAYTKIGTKWITPKSTKFCCVTEINDYSPIFIWTVKIIFRAEQWGLRII